MNQQTALTRWLIALGRAAATSSRMAPCSVGALLVRRGAERPVPNTRR